MISGENPENHLLILKRTGKPVKKSNPEPVWQTDSL